MAKVLKELIIAYPKLLKTFPKLKQFHGFFGLDIPQVESGEGKEATEPEEKKEKE